MKYRYTGEAEAFVPELNQIVRTGDVVEADEINNDLFVPVDDKKKQEPTPAPAPVEEAPAS